MKILKLVHATIALWFYNWAAREINPLHPDLPRIMRRQMELNAKLREIFA